MLGGWRDLVVINDEAHHVYGEKKTKKGEDPGYIKWSQILQRMPKAAKVSLVVDLWATPWYGSGSPKPEETLFEYEELMRFVPKAERAAWHAKAMDVLERADLGSLIELSLKAREIERLVERLRTATDAEIEDLSHYRTEPAARRLAKSHPDVAAKVYRALGMRILNAKKSKYFDAALSNFEDAKRCYERSGRHRDWEVLVADVRGAHHRKAGFMADFERLVGGRGPSDEPSFLERARSRWSAPREP